MAEMVWQNVENRSWDKKLSVRNAITGDTTDGENKVKSTKNIREDFFRFSIVGVLLPQFQKAFADGIW